MKRLIFRKPTSKPFDRCWGLLWITDTKPNGVVTDYYVIAQFNEYQDKWMGIPDGLALGISNNGHCMVGSPKGEISGWMKFPGQRARSKS